MKNKKGFVLVETIVAAVFVLGFFSFIIANLLPLVGEYEKKSVYDTPESIYNAHLIRKMFLKNTYDRIENLVDFPEDREYYVFENTDVCLYLDNMNYCNKLLSKDFLDVKKIIITNYNVTSLKRNSSNFERALKEYIDYMPSYESGSLYAGYYFCNRLIIMFNDGRITNMEFLFSKNL